ncbi:MAG: polynucleotide kinase-phosphatase [Fimbriimonadaceae bacterium]
MKIEIPAFGLVILMGSSGSGKSTFAAKHFKPTEIVSSDQARGIVCDDENSLEATTDAFTLVHFIVEQRLKNMRLCVVDATNVDPDGRKALIKIARRYHAFVHAIALDLPESVCHERNAARPNRQFGAHVVRRQRSMLRRSLGVLRREGIRDYFVLRSQEEVDGAEVVRVKAWNDRRHEAGPFDIIGDVHGCIEELRELLGLLGYAPDGTPPEGRTAVFVGDLVDRGPDSVGVLRLVMKMTSDGHAIVLPGNHDDKLMRKLGGSDVTMGHGLKETVEQLEAEPSEFVAEVRAFLKSLVGHYVFDGGRLVVAHAGMKEDMQGRTSGRVRDFALYGETTGETDEFGLPVRYDWASEYRGRAAVVYGHTPVPDPEWVNNTINIDTGCVFGGRLTALRYPERETVTVHAKRTYAEPKRPLEKPQRAVSAQQELDDVLDLDDVLGKRLVETRLQGRVTIREENALAALEVMSRFANDPKWIVYLPPTMSPCETTEVEGYLERPEQALDYFSRYGIESVVCEEKHMGSRAVMVLARDPDVVRERFGIVTGQLGSVMTRTGRRFFDDELTEQGLVKRTSAAFERAGLWEELKTGWAVLDCELMPWSAKALQLLQRQYAPVGTAAVAATSALLDDLERHGNSELIAATAARRTAALKYIAAYQQYCWRVTSVDDLKLAPFHLLATEGTVYTDKDHVWHMDTLARACAHDPVLLATSYVQVDLSKVESRSHAVEWWEELVSRGGEGMVVKPLGFTALHDGRLIQPALKVRGPEYLRIIYGPEYLLANNLTRLRRRGLMRKRGLAAREFALGIEALERFVAREPLRRVHECVFGVLAMESEPVDPRL